MMWLVTMVGFRLSCARERRLYTESPGRQPKVGFDAFALTEFPHRPLRPDGQRGNPT